MYDNIYHVSDMYWNIINRNKINPTPSKSKNKATNNVRDRLDKYTIVATFLVSWNIRCICVVGPDKKNDPHNAIILPNVVLKTNGADVELSVWLLFLSINMHS